MPRNLKLIVLLVAFTMSMLASSAGAATLADFPIDAREKFDGPACTRHAEILFLACTAERREDFLIHIADCIYVTSEEEEKECRQDANGEAAETAEECEEVFEARLDVCELVGEDRFDIDFDPEDFVDPDDIGDEVEPNPYWPLTAGHTHVILAEDEVVVVTVTDEVRDVGGLPCRVVRDLVFEESEDDEGEIEYEAIEVTQDWFAQHMNGDIVYCGENSYEIEDGLIDNTDGSFANGTERARAGFLLRALPVVGEGDRQEMASDEAEDYIEYVSLAASPSDEEGGEAEAFPCDGGCLQTFEVNPHDPNEGEFKYYLPGQGFVLATKLEDDEPTGEREEVTCMGDSLDVLDDPACGIGDPDALLEALCFWAPETFCSDD